MNPVILAWIIISLKRNLDNAIFFLSLFYFILFFVCVYFFSKSHFSSFDWMFPGKLLWDLLVNAFIWNAIFISIFIKTIFVKSILTFEYSIKKCFLTRFFYLKMFVYSHKKVLYIIITYEKVYSLTLKLV